MLCLSQQEAAELVKAHRSSVVRWEEGKGGINANSRLQIKTYCEKLAEYADSLGLNGRLFQPHLLCPGEFPVPEYVGQQP
jgi:DNA-binding XRE family transcriptional regulator